MIFGALLMQIVSMLLFIFAHDITWLIAARALRMLMPTAHAHERGGLMSAFLVLSYLAFCIPALIAGYCAHSAGLVTTSNVYGAVVIVLALLALAGLVLRHVGSDVAGNR